ncbi:tetratricopeptide repeat protein [Saltatorellus ferox]|uniref:tetratricopeptide repeat protein n=1 Tax=Saltatorellus ferox TaxID=2528018 RepID=UPI003AF3DA28
MSRTPGRSLGASENQATYQNYLDGWAELNRSLVLGEPWSGDERNVAFLNSGGQGEALDFADMGGVLGLDAIGDGRSAASIDIDFDGDEDIVLSNRTEPRIQIFRNRLADGVPTLAVRLVGTGKSGTEAVGGIVYATPVQGMGEEEPTTAGVVPGKTLRRTRTIGSGYLAQTSAWLRFAFPDDAWDGEPSRGQRVHLQVRWPRSATVEDFGLVRMGSKRLVLEQGKGVAREVTAPRPVRLEAAELPAFDLSPENGRRLALPAPSSIPSLAVRGVSGRTARLFGITPDGPRGAGQPVVAVVWNSKEPDAIVRLGALGALSEEAAAAEALVIAIDLAEEASDSGAEEAFPAQLQRGAALLSRAGFDGDELAAVGSTKEILAEIVAWRMGRPEPPALPWSLIVGPDGRLDVVRTGAWVPGEAGRDFLFCKTLGNARLALASPFGGRWVNPPLEANLASLKSRLERRGISEAVRELELARVTTAATTSAEVQVRLGQTYLGSNELEKALRAFDLAIESEPESAIAHKARAYTLQLLKRPVDSIEAWGRAIELDPSDPNSRVNRAFAAIEAGEIGIAREELDVLIATQGADSEAAQAVSRALESK